MFTPEEFEERADRTGIARVSDNVAYGWIKCGSQDCPHPHDIPHLWVWHLCDGSLLPNRDSTIPGYHPRWVPTGVGLHTLVQEEPLTITASIYWPLCCGLHGFITNGKWMGV